jgi:hypothetical protein
VISDAAIGRDGVGTYYEDLVSQLRPRVEDISLIAPLAGAKADHQRFSIPMPGDATQRLAYPKTRALARLLDSRAPHVVILPTVGPYAVLGLRLARRRHLNAVDEFGFTPVWAGAFGADFTGYPAIEALLDLGANVNSRDNNGLTPLGYARQLGNPWLIEILERYGGTE